jgi:pyruvate formate lyase activating enzyme
MSKGIIFDIREQSVHDGPGVRVTVFFKGCPLRCVWCHNPEGLSPKREIIKNTARCTGCGKCLTPCGHGECEGFGVCVRACPNGLPRIAGTETEASALVSKLERYAPILKETGGGVTLSGGEPLAQPEFLLEMLGLLKENKMHTVLETSGYGDREVFKQVVELCDLVYFDLKHMSPAPHKKYTGVDNGIIHQNLNTLMDSGKTFTVRLPMIPQVNITEEHFHAVARALSPARGRAVIELLPYNPFGGAKYPAVNRVFDYHPGDTAKAPRYFTEIFDDAGLHWRVL